MKKIFAILGVALMLVACSKETDSKMTETDTVDVVTKDTVDVVRETTVELDTLKQ